MEDDARIFNEFIFIDDDGEYVIVNGERFDVISLGTKEHPHDIIEDENGNRYNVVLYSYTRKIMKVI